MANQLATFGQNAPNDQYKWRVLFVAMIGMLMAALDGSIVNVSIPAMMANLSVGTHDIEWVSTAYMLAFAAFMPLTAWLGSKIGNKWLYIGAMGVFTLGSVMCGLAWSLPVLIFSRVFQALGAGAVTPTGMAMIGEVFAPSERGKAMGIGGIGVIAGPAIGPTLGGILTRYYGWRSIFMVNLPIGIAGIWLAFHLLKADAAKKVSPRRFDFGGFVFFTLFIVAFLIGLAQGEYKGWHSTYIYTCWILSAVGLWGFLLIQSLIEDGVIDLSLLKYPAYTISLLITFVRSIALFGGTFLLPLFLQQIQGYDEIICGLILLPGSLVIALVMPISGILSDKIGPRFLVIAGLFLLALSMFQYRTLEMVWSREAIIWVTILRGIGFGFLMAPINAVAMNAVPPEKVKMASSTLSIAQQIGGSVGITLLTTTLDHRRVFHLNAIGSDLDLKSALCAKTAGQLALWAQKLGHSAQEAKAFAGALISQRASQQAQINAFQDAFLLCGTIVAAALVVSWWLPKSAVKAKEDLSVAE